ncbi:MAG: IS481 family transposase, partial [Pseudonocardiaceae bacterium]
MGHRNARLTFHGRCLLVHRVRNLDMPVAHVAKAMGISRQCAHRWLARFDEEGSAGLVDRSSRPKKTPTRTDVDIEAAVVAARLEHRRGQDWLGAELGVAPRTVSRILRRHDLPRLCECDPMTGAVIRASKTTAVRYERATPGELGHMDVKKVGRIPDGGGWRAHGRQMGKTSKQKKAKIGFDYIHSVVDDHSRFAYTEILPDETAPTTAAFFARAIHAFGDVGIELQAVMTDNAWNYTHSNDFRQLLADHHIDHLVIKPHCPWQNGKVERFNRTMQIEWIYRRVFTSNAERADALTPWLEDYNYRRRHTALGGLPPISRLSPT